MVRNLSRAAAFMFVMSLLAVGQDPTKVEPRHYKLDFENDRVQVVSVHYGPHEKSGLHEHPGGVVVSITEGHLRMTDESGKVREVFAKPGEVRWYAPFKHKVENLSDGAYDAVYVGIKGKLASVSSNSESSAADEIAKVLAQRLSAATRP